MQPNPTQHTTSTNNNKDMEDPIVRNNDYTNHPQAQATMAASPQQNGAAGTERKAYTKLPPTRRDDRKIFVGGLPSNVTDEEFLAFFSQFGTVLDSVVMFDRETRRSRGFGFVTFEDPNVVRLLLDMRVEGTDGNGRVQMRGKVCEIKAAQPKESNYNKNRRGGNNKGGYRSYQQPQQQGYGSPGGQASYMQQGYAPPSPEGVPTQVNQGVPSSLAMAPNGHAAAAMYSPYSMGGYYAAAPAATYSAYMATAYAAPDGAYYDQQGNTMAAAAAEQHPAYVPTSAMTAAVPGPRAQSNGAYGYGTNAFVPVSGDATSKEPVMTPERTKDDASPSQGTSNGEEAKQT